MVNAIRAAACWNGSISLDVVEIDAASNRGVDDARELRERAMYAPSGDDRRQRVYIVDEAHMLTREAWNALLKILEEPPPRAGLRLRDHRAAEDRPSCRSGSPGAGCNALTSSAWAWATSSSGCRMCWPRRTCRRNPTRWR